MFLANFSGVVLNDYKLIKEAWNHPSLIGRPKLHAARERTGGISRGIVIIFKSRAEGAEMQYMRVQQNNIFEQVSCSKMATNGWNSADLPCDICGTLDLEESRWKA